MNAPIRLGPNRRSLRISFSRIGITKVSAFPEPVRTSTTTSLCCVDNDIVAAWTGVIWEWPIASMTPRLQERREISPSWPLLMHTHTHKVRGTGREDHVPARAVADIEERGMIDFKFLTGFGS